MKLKRRPLRILITAGPTREYIDSVRYISNDSSGRMGFALAAAAAARGHQVLLVHGPVALTAPANVTARPVVSSAEMLQACKRIWPTCDVLVAAAAVSDYTPAAPSRTKLKKGAAEMTLRLKPTADILATLSRARQAGQVVIGFALEDRAPRRHAQDKLRRKGLDAIVLNTPRAIGVRRSQVHVLEREGEWAVWPEAAKAATAQRLVRLAEGLVRRAR